MLLLGGPSLRRCSSQLTENWPCTFKQLWFHDMPFLLIPGAGTRLWAVVRKTSYRTYIVVNKGLLNHLLSTLYIRFTLQIHQMTKESLCSFAAISNPIITLKKKVRSTAPGRRRQRTSPVSLSSLPAELRIKIFAYVTEGVCMRVVGYRDGSRDSFYFKQRSNCAVAMICKQFHEEALEAYFRNLHVHIKAATPSEFSGDMSRFGKASFRDRIKNVKLADWDEHRRSKMCSAFKNARIELDSKHASGARKGAYYFG